MELRLKSFKDFLLETKTEGRLRAIAAGGGPDAARARAELDRIQQRRNQFNTLLARQPNPEAYKRASVAVKQKDADEQRQLRGMELRARAAGRVDPETYRFLGKYGHQR